MASVNGTYENACCSPILLKDGVLIASNKRIPLKLRVEKWGNEAELATRIRLQDGKVVSSWESGSDVILFDKS